MYQYINNIYILLLLLIILFYIIYSTLFSNDNNNLNNNRLLDLLLKNNTLETSNSIKLNVDIDYLIDYIIDIHVNKPKLCKCYLHKNNNYITPNIDKIDKIKEDKIVKEKSSNVDDYLLMPNENNKYKNYTL